MPRHHAANYGEYMRTANNLIVTFANDMNLPHDWFTFQPTEAHPVVVSAVRKAAILSPYIKQFVQDMIQACDGTELRYSRNRMKMLYPVIWNKEKNGVLVFPNLTLDDYNLPRYGNTGALDNENPFTPTHLASVRDTILSDLKHEHKRQAWMPMSRGIKRLGIRKSMSITRAIARCFTLDGNPITDKQLIDNLGQKMLEMNMPSEFHFVTDIDGIRAMYVREHSETPHSCMDSRHGFQLPDDERPVDFYGYCPNTAGAYIARGSTVLARTICFWDTNEKYWYTTRVYASRSANADELMKRCKEQGIRDGSKHNLVSHCTFDIPSTMYNNSECMPLPYFDSKPFAVLAAKLGNNGFTVTMANKRPEGKGWELPNLGSTSGAFFASDCTECYHCNQHLDLDNDDFINVEGNIYCDLSCAHEDDVMLVVSSADEDYMYDRNVPNDYFRGAYQSSTYVFSNRQAAINRGNIYRPLPWADTEGDIFINPHQETCSHFTREIEVVLEDGTHCDMTVFNYHRLGSVSHLPLHEFADNGRIRPLSITANTTLLSQFGAVSSYFASTDNEVNFTDSVFDDAIDGSLNETAPLIDGVHIYQHPTVTNEDF